MNGTAVAKRYADGFLEFVRASIGFEKGLEELGGVKGIFRDNPGLKEFLESPEITFAEKCAAVEKIFSPGFSQEMRFFLQLLLKKSRIGSFDAMAEYARLKYAHGEEIDATLTAGYPLDTGQIEAIKDSLEKKFAKRMHLYMKLDPDLLGGVKVVIGNIVIDGSIEKRLDDLRKKLMAAKVS